MLPEGNERSSGISFTHSSTGNRMGHTINAEKKRIDRLIPLPLPPWSVQEVSP